MSVSQDHGTPLLAVRGLTKSFAGFPALVGVDLTLKAGEIHALLGENGAGKSTLIKTVTGIVARDAGTVTLDGTPIAPRSGEAAQESGIATVYQEVNLLPNLSVAQNLFLGREPTRFGFVRHGEMRRRAAALLAEFGLAIETGAPLGDYSVAVQHLVAIARAVDLSARVLILDEPTASLDAHEVEILFRVMRRLAARGLGIVFVTHFLDQVYAVTDRITVLRNGRLVGSWATDELPRLKLIEAMLGRELSEATAGTGQADRHRPGGDAEGSEVAHYERYGKPGYVAPFDLTLKRGEVVGLAGLLGSGRTETARLLFGAEVAQTGQVQIDGAPVRLRSPRDAIRHRFGYCPEERKTEGIITELSVRENIILALQARRGPFRPIPRREQDALARRYIAMLDIRPPDPERPIGLLSGGNQQKALLARWLATEPQVLILDEPTRGIDVGAHAEIIRLIRRLCDDGLALVVISSELEEIVTYADRVVVMRDRAQIATLEGDAVDVTAILKAIAGDEAAEAA
ncbi:sugar ABC transporter ATP-binding protein (plasmid) [Methylobacterium currus]|uniref:sugar ABC transporter ATP-binding protein n=1 Tax=Methylobacterium currus TaxID=2051553 RepID=UPI001E3F5C95|nr:sugar ABC transporter ATP-binding protein [Methylobacterium currus]UHC20147.1 sugar ABC transporter ATP-binding protein [Methylobacterium currus]